MSEAAVTGPPSWMPAAVGSAYRHGTGTDDDQLFLAMELLFGQSLWALWDACRAFAMAAAERAARPMRVATG